MKKRTEQVFNPELPIGETPATHPSLSDGATVVKVAVSEVVGVGINHAAGWPWWAGAQLPVAYLFWRLMHERAFYERIVRAWNRRLAPDRESPPAMSVDEANRFIEELNNRDIP